MEAVYACWSNVVANIGGKETGDASIGFECLLIGVPAKRGTTENHWCLGEGQ